MNGHNKYIAAVVVALASAATVGARDPSVAARPASVPSPSIAVEAPAIDIDDTAATDDTRPEILDPKSRPHLLDDDDAVADLVVRLVGGVCSGTPITGTVYVVTAAHCVLTPSGEVVLRTVVRGHHQYPAVAVLVDPDYHDHPTAANDAAVLILAEEIPGPSARVGTALPESGELVLAGFQPIDSDGSLLRGKDANDHPRPKGASGTANSLPYEPAGCVTSPSELDVSAKRVMVPCGLIPGASGGGLYTEVDGEHVLVGILSSVTTDYSANGVVPLASLLEMLAHPEEYVPGSTGSSRLTHVERS